MAKSLLTQKTFLLLAINKLINPIELLSEGNIVPHAGTAYPSSILYQMNFPIRGYNECLIPYLLVACSLTHDVPAEVYHAGWVENNKIVAPHQLEGYNLNLRYQSKSR